MRVSASLNESNPSTIEVLPEEIPDELGCEWRVLHPFELPGVQFPMDSTPPNQRRLAENDALVEPIQTTEEEAEEEVEVEEDENGSMKDQAKD